MSTTTVPSRPLFGLSYRVPDELPAAVRAEVAALLGSFGATVCGDRPSDIVERERVPGLPLGTLELFWSALAAAAVLRGEGTALPSRSDALDHLLLPAKLSRGRWRRPPEPVPAAGGGSVCIDVAGPDDREIFERFNAAIGDRPLDAESLAAEAQDWRLPVTPYRSRRAGRSTSANSGIERGAPLPVDDADGISAGYPAVDQPVVVDLTAMWSGPLCTRLLADVGATVHKIEPACRPDGTRLDEHGLHEALNHGKTHHDLDLRLDDQRAEFEELVRNADLVIDNFSPRVRPNLNITRTELLAINPDVLTLSLPAFPLGATEREWVAYGTGVHAMSGLGMTSGGPCSPAITYPDPIAGAVGSATATAMLVGRSRGWHQRSDIEVTLASAIEPLIAVPDDDGETLRAPLDESALISLGVWS